MSVAVAGSNAALPEGRRGQVLALGVTLVLLALLWFAAINPLLAWYADRDAVLEQRQALASRMEALAASVPGLQRLAQQAASQPRSVLLEGGTEAIAGAALQQHVQEDAERAGLRLSSAEGLPADQAGDYRRIRLHVTVTGTWAQLVRFLIVIGQASPRMLVDEIQLGGSRSLTTDLVKPLDASLTVNALYRGAAPVASE